MSKIREVVILLCFLVLVSCGHGKKYSFSEEPDLDLLKTFFEYQIKNYHSSLVGGANVYCLHVNNYIISPSFANHFRLETLLMVERHTCEKIDNSITLSAFEFQRVSPSKTYVFGGYAENGRATIKLKYTMLLKDGLWRVSSLKRIRFY